MGAINVPSKCGYSASRSSLSVSFFTRIHFAATARFDTFRIGFNCSVVWSYDDSRNAKSERRSGNVSAKTQNSSHIGCQFQFQVPLSLSGSLLPNGRNSPAVLKRPPPSIASVASNRNVNCLALNSSFSYFTHTVITCYRGAQLHYLPDVSARNIRKLLRKVPLPWYASRKQRRRSGLLHIDDLDPLRYAKGIVFQQSKQKPFVVGAAARQGDATPSSSSSSSLSMSSVESTTLLLSLLTVSLPVAGAPHKWYINT